MAKIAIISDTHFGYASGTERENDCYESTEDAFRKSKDADIILLPGDIFDNRTPRPEVWARSMRILEKPHLEKDRGVKVDRIIGKDDEISPMAVKGIPIVAIHGTHDRRGKHLLNPVQGLEAGFLVHLHLSVVVFDVRGEKIAIHGMGGVPEIYAKAVMERWDPKPIEGCYNIFVLHQSIDPFIYSPLEPPSLKLEDMPEGFDLYVCGHVHYPINTKVHDKPFLIPGSVVTTQVNKMEGEHNKGFYMISTKENGEDIDFVEIDARKVFYSEINLKGDGVEDARKKVDDVLAEISNESFEKKPLVRVRLMGSLKKGISMRDLDLRSITDKYDMMISVGEKLKRGSTKKSVRERKSIEEIGMKILTEETTKRGLDLSPQDMLLELLDEKPEGIIDSLIRQRRLKASASS